MAVTKIHPIKTTLNKAIDYICNPDKTDDKILISSYGCSYETADIEFAFTLSKARDKGDNLGHLILSILVYTFFSRMFDLMLPPVAKHSIVVA